MLLHIELKLIVIVMIKLFVDELFVLQLNIVEIYSFNN